MLPNQLVILSVLGAILLWLLILSFLIYKTFRFYRRLSREAGKKDLRLILEKLLSDQKDSAKSIHHLQQQFRQYQLDSVYDIQKIGLVRYNPFAETGGNQSFCLSILDDKNNGVVISSLHSRDATRVYAKPVKNSRGVEFKLSEEEKRAIKKARKVKSES
jgi:hypothetical protein